MKKIILSICILASGIATSQDISFTNKETQPIIFSNNGYFQNGLAYTGKYVVYFENGKIKEELTIKEGKLDGAFVRNHENGKPMEIGNYETNLKFF
jgi:antitoxin component YwqK of YwqJK toxin-antitoxin module